MIIITEKELVDALRAMDSTTRPESDALALTVAKGRIAALERKLEDAIKMFTEIDNRTKWSEVEPEWWMNMVNFAKSIRELLKN